MRRFYARGAINLEVLSLIVILIAFSFYFIFRPSSNPVKKNSQKEIQPTSLAKKATTTIRVNNKKSTKIETIEASGGAVLLKYTSDNLGVSFNYLNEQSQQYIVQETENKICITYEKNDIDCSKGQFVEIFSKTSTQSLKDAIDEVILKSYLKSDCFVADYKGEGSSNSEYEYAIISYPKTSDQTNPLGAPASEKCPENYRETNGIRYFMMSRVAPEKFAFFNIGQYAIFGGFDRTPWQRTFQFVQ